MFAVLYRWRIKPGTDLPFREAWGAMTDVIKARHGTGGSRLHRTDDGEFVAYAVWPSRQDWEAAKVLPSASAELGAQMRACIEEAFPATPLEVLDDRVTALPGARSAGA